MNQNVNIPSIICNACNVEFADYDAQKKHYRLDFHRYNLKRRIVDLPPVSMDQFSVRQQLAGVHKDKSGADKYVGKCNVCSKSFRNPKLLNQHLSTKKHLMLAKQNSSDESVMDESTTKMAAESSSISVEDEMGDENESKLLTMEEMELEIERIKEKNENGFLDIEQCIFCAHRESDIESNVVHMQKEHGFFVPDVEYIVDLNGLIGYVMEKVKIGKICLYCNGVGKTFDTYLDCQKHMVAKSHCKLLYQPDEDMDEYMDFYDFTTANENDDEIEISYTGEMMLPDGRCVGNRQLRKYYKQNLSVPNLHPATLAATKERLLLCYQDAKLPSTSALMTSEMAKMLRKKRNQLVGYHSIKESRIGITLRKKHDSRLFTRSHKMQRCPNRKVMITV